MAFELIGKFFSEKKASGDTEVKSDTELNISKAMDSAKYAFKRRKEISKNARTSMSICA